MDPNKGLHFFRKNETMPSDAHETGFVSRRDFVRTLGAGGGAVAVGGWLVRTAGAEGEGGEAGDGAEIGMIVVDFNKCTGCRTCEAVCSEENNKVAVGGEMLKGLGNPQVSKVSVLYFNPPVDVPNRCLQCNDAPCIKSCPVDPKALYRDEKTMAVKTDHEKCIGCGSCARTCEEKRVGVIVMNPETNRPEGICTLCEGDPACVKYCPFGALTYVKGELEGGHYGIPPEEAAKQLTELWYYSQE